MFALYMPTIIGTRSRKTEPTPQDEERAKGFAEWQKNARVRMGWNIPKLAIESGYSDTQIRLYDLDGYGGIDSTRRYRQPKREYVEAVGLATRLHPDNIKEGLVLAGLIIPSDSTLSDQAVASIELVPVTLSTGEIIHLRSDEPEPENTVRAIEAFLTGLRAGQKRQN